MLESFGFAQRASLSKASRGSVGRLHLGDFEGGGSFCVLPRLSSPGAPGERKLGSFVSPTAGKKNFSK